MAPFFIADTAARGPGSASTASAGAHAEVLTIQDDRHAAQRMSTTCRARPAVALDEHHVRTPCVPVHAARFGR